MELILYTSTPDPGQFQHTENRYIPPDSDVKLIEDFINSLEQNLSTQLNC
jgi:hypothetical protein